MTWIAWTSFIGGAASFGTAIFIVARYGKRVLPWTVPLLLLSAMNFLILLNRA
jgi:hypothetical protein